MYHWLYMHDKNILKDIHLETGMQLRNYNIKICLSDDQKTMNTQLAPTCSDIHIASHCIIVATL